MKFAFVIALAFCCATAQSQVFKCQDSAGKTIYSDAPCTSGKSNQIHGSRSTEAIELERERAQLARERYLLEQEKRNLRRPVAPEPEPTPQVAPGVARVDSHECRTATRNLGSGTSPESKMHSQRVYEIACFGDQAASIEKARAGRTVINKRVERERPRTMFCDRNGFCS